MSHRKARLAYRYGITLQEFDALLKQQGGRCAICHKPLGETYDTCVDHDHETKEVRGILCRHCNKLLGFAEDNLSTVIGAMGYLRKHRRRS